MNRIFDRITCKESQLSDRERSKQNHLSRHTALVFQAIVLLCLVAVQAAYSGVPADSNCPVPADSASLFSDSSANLRSADDSSLIYRGRNFDNLLAERNEPAALDPIKLISGILIVFGLLFLSMWVLKKYMHRPGSVISGGSQVQVLHNFHLSPKKKISLVRAYDRFIILGMTDHSINALAEITDPAEMKAIEEKLEQSRKGTAPDFGSIYSNLLRKKGKEAK